MCHHLQNLCLYKSNTEIQVFVKICLQPIILIYTWLFPKVIVKDVRILLPLVSPISFPIKDRIRFKSIRKYAKYHDKKRVIDQVKMTEITCYIKRSNQQIINITRKFMKNIQLFPIIGLRY